MEMNKNRSEKFERQNKWKRKRRIMDGLNYRSGNELSGGLPTWEPKSTFGVEKPGTILDMSSFIYL